ncbi:hypothetical protein CWI39_0213p0010 [Hamiltosporidium magnivora]|uniref:Uncharacterized protein n=1 Tax=Hamiltosporidium magnivora TaxID=148818 RepID=A0A4Q9LJ25_9MICR|nr:hypothetical protein CWI36_0378p0010 [Hamiltosporidium magnivora]TBU08199.1 hypothetical protein CWI39_0213p0010 [Hamiltosporidium magnivora]
MNSQNGSRYGFNIQRCDFKLENKNILDLIFKVENMYNTKFLIDCSEEENFRIFKDICEKSYLKSCYTYDSLI